jgi:3-hydroxyacyl-[acyl-carrier-protein] dehydratase
VRMRLIDEVDRVHAWRSVTARTSTSSTRSFWRDEGDGLQLPVPLVLEAVCEAGAWLVLTSAGVRERTALLSIESVTVLGVVRPGDVLDLVGTVEARSADVAVLSGRASVDGRSVLEARGMLCALFAAEQRQCSARPRLRQDGRRRAQPMAVPAAAAA